MELLSITGLPRTGTMWTHLCLMASPDTCGPAFESGCELLWTKTVPRTQNEVDKEWLAMSESQWGILRFIALFCGNAAAQLGPTAFCDMLLRPWTQPDKTAIVSKTPAFDPLPKWPQDYARESKIVHHARLVVCYRDAEESLISGCRT